MARNQWMDSVRACASLCQSGLLADRPAVFGRQHEPGRSLATGERDSSHSFEFVGVGDFAVCDWNCDHHLGFDRQAGFGRIEVELLPGLDGAG